MMIGIQNLRVVALAVSGIALYGTTLCRLSARTDAENQRQKPDASPESFERLASQAQDAMDSGRIPEAIQLYTRTTELRPEWTEGWWHLGTLLFDAGRFAEARAAFEHFVAVEKEQPGPGFGMLGLSAFQLKLYSKALAALERGRKLGLGNNPEFVHSVLYHAGILHTLLGEPEIALQRLTLLANQMAAEHPDNPKDAVLGDDQLLDAFGVAALRVRKLPSDIPDTKSTVVRQAGRAQAFIALQDQVSAEPLLKELVTLHPSEPGVHYMYGVFL